MMNVKRLSLTLAMNAALLAGIAVTIPAANAQDQPPASTETQSAGKGHRQPPSPQQMVDRLGKKLNLTEDQKSQLLPVITERQQKMQALRSDTSLARKDKRQQAKAILQDSDQKINAVLNDQQKEQYAQLKKERRHHMREARQNQNQ